MEEFTLNETLSTHELYCLLALTRNTLHGYGVCSQVADDSAGKLITRPRTVYGVLERLERRRLVESIAAEPGRIARRYRLTKAGERTLEAEAGRLSEVIVQIRYKLGGHMFR